MTVINIYACQCNEEKLAEICAVIESINSRLSRALGEPAAPAGRRQRGGHMATLDEVLVAVQAASTRTDSIIADRAAIKQQLDDALSGVTLPAGVQAKIDEILNIETADAAKIDAALNANVPPPA